MVNLLDQFLVDVLQAAFDNEHPGVCSVFYFVIEQVSLDLSHRELTDETFNQSVCTNLTSIGGVDKSRKKTTLNQVRLLRSSNAGLAKAIIAK